MRILPPQVIIIVEDDDAIAEYMTEVLQDEGYHVLTARHGKEALAVMAITLPQLIITDLMMPIMDGLELCQHLKVQSTTAPIPIIMCSASTNRYDQHAGLYTSFLAKPFTLDDLMSHVTHILNPLS